jgi:thymidylate synthase
MEKQSNQEAFEKMDMAYAITKNLHPEYQYLNLIRQVLQHGILEKGRNGNTYALFGYNMRFNLSDGTLPLLTTKQVAWKTCLKELLWFIQGCTNNAVLQAQKVHIWDGNSTREFLDGRGLTNNRVNDLGPIYGYQWRHFNASYIDCDASYEGQGIDQLAQIIETLKTDPTSRRMIMTAWNPCQLDQMALPPCHILCQFNVLDGRLSCTMYQRSCDIGLGVPFNIASYSMLTHILAKHCDLLPGEFIYNMGNVHIYDDHVEPLKQQLERVPYEFPKVSIINKHDNINDYVLEDVMLTTTYQYHPAIKMAMRA